MKSMIEATSLIRALLNLACYSIRWNYDHLVSIDIQQLIVLLFEPADIIWSLLDGYNISMCRV